MTDPALYEPLAPLAEISPLREQLDDPGPVADLDDPGYLAAVERENPAPSPTTDERAWRAWAESEARSITASA